ncbi:hypothetical protein [Pantoea ananatis]|uniref:hypothetical protein n=1 Tax=Pantoea ananas TaxID=553 RepID=UPI0005C4A160|nr:hypothetical protein [Pantoea ananatis]
MTVRLKVKCDFIQETEGKSQTVHMSPSEAEGEASLWKKSDKFIVHISNPTLFGKLVTGEEYTLDITPAD